MGEIVSFYVVTDAAPDSELGDIMFEATPHFFYNWAIGGNRPWEEDNPKLYDDWTDAMVDAKARLSNPVRKSGAKGRLAKAILLGDYQDMCRKIVAENPRPYLDDYGLSVDFSMDLWDAIKYRYGIDVLEALVRQKYAEEVSASDRMRVLEGKSLGKSGSIGRREDLDGVMPRVFGMIRQDDESGHSGTGKVVDGIVFPSGETVVCWRTAVNSVSVFQSYEAFHAVHVGQHPSNGSIIEWYDLGDPRYDKGLLSVQKGMSTMSLSKSQAEMKKAEVSLWYCYEQIVDMAVDEAVELAERDGLAITPEKAAEIKYDLVHQAVQDDFYTKLEQRAEGIIRMAAAKAITSGGMTDTLQRALVARWGNRVYGWNSYQIEKGLRLLGADRLVASLRTGRLAKGKYDFSNEPSWSALAEEVPWPEENEKVSYLYTEANRGTLTPEAASIRWEPYLSKLAGWAEKMRQAVQANGDSNQDVEDYLEDINFASPVAALFGADLKDENFKTVVHLPGLWE